MKSFKEYLLEGQAEVDAAIKAIDTAHDRERKIWHARGRLETMIARATNQNVADSQYYKLNRKARQKVNRRVNPTLKKTFTNLSPEDRMQFLLSPHNSLSPESAEFHDKYSPGGASGQTMYDKLVRQNHQSMFPLKDLRDAEDILSVVRSDVGRYPHRKDLNMADSKKPAQVVDISDRGDDIFKGGTFHERKKMRTERNKRKSSKK